MFGGLFRLTSPLLAPPKAPRNCFFPWFNFVVHKSGTYLEPNRIAFRVPIHLTKPEIREYLRKIYNTKVIKVNTMVRLPKTKRGAHGQYYKVGAQYKKAIVTCEENIPDENSRNIYLNPSITKHDVQRPAKTFAFRPGQNRSTDWQPRHRHAWKEPIPLLLRGETNHPSMSRGEEQALRTDPTMPYQHFTNRKEIPLGTPMQEFPTVDLAYLRNMRESQKKPLSAAEVRSARDAVE